MLMCSTYEGIVIYNVMEHSVLHSSHSRNYVRGYTQTIIVVVLGPCEQVEAELNGMSTTERIHPLANQ